MPNKRFVPTQEQRKAVERGAAVGLTEIQIAEVLGINKSTLRKYFLPELTTAGMKANMNVAGALYNAAIKGNVTAQIFWCKTRLRWRETDQADVLLPPTSIMINVQSEPKHEPGAESEGRESD